MALVHNRAVLIASVRLQEKHLTSANIKHWIGGIAMRRPLELQVVSDKAKVNNHDETFVAEVANSVVVGVEVLCGHDSERADGSQRTAVLAVQLVHTVAIDNELAFLTARQIEVVK
jgi:hypothetical protein